MASDISPNPQAAAPGVSAEAQAFQDLLDVIHAGRFVPLANSEGLCQSVLDNAESALTALLAGAAGGRQNISERQLRAMYTEEQSMDDFNAWAFDRDYGLDGPNPENWTSKQRELRDAWVDSRSSTMQAIFGGLSNGVETKTYPDGTIATGSAPLPSESPAAPPRPVGAPQGVSEADVEAAVIEFNQHSDSKPTALKMRRVLESFAASRQGAGALPASESYVQPVPYHCDRITWRGRYYSLPLATPSPAQAEPKSLWANRASIERALTREADTKPYLYAEQVAINDVEFLIGKPTGAAEGAEPTADAERPNNAVLVPCDKLAEVQKDVERLDFVLSAIVADEAKIIDILHDEDGLPLSRERMLENIDTARAAIDAARAAQKGQP